MGCSLKIFPQMCVCVTQTMADLGYFSKLSDLELFKDKNGHISCSYFIQNSLRLFCGRTAAFSCSSFPP